MSSRGWVCCRGAAVGPGVCGMKPLPSGAATLGGPAGPVPLPQPSVFSSPVNGELPVRLGCQSNSPELVRPKLTSRHAEA